MMKYHIIVAAHNCMQWLPGSLESINDQTYSNYDVCVVDDASDDPVQADFTKQYCETMDWAYILNDSHKGAMCNQVAAIAELAPASDQDVIVVVDGDDQFAHKNVLKHLDEYYATGVDMTYGTYRNEPDPDKSIPLYIGEYSRQVIKTGTYRTCGELLYNHLRTFKFGLYNQLDENVDFKWPNGDWFQAGPDCAIMLPCLELSRGNYMYVREIMYQYNCENPTSEWRYRPSEVNRVHQYIMYQLPRKC